MIDTVFAKPLRALGPAVLALTALLAPAQAQQGYTPAPSAGARNPMCVRLEGQLSGLDQGNLDPAKAAQVKRYQETADKQQAELDRVSLQARRLGCEGRGFFSLFSGQPPQCVALNTQVQQMRGNLDRVLADLQRLQGNSADREGQRRAILASLGQNDCGPQYRAYANRGGGGFFDSLFGPGTILNPDPAPSVATGDTYRTLCVRTCDGYYFPISYSTTPARFVDDEKICQRMCPASEVTLYSHRNPGEDVAQAVSTTGRQYSELPTAFAYRKTFNQACGCKAAGQTWADALKQLDDQTVERGDIVVTEERAKQLAQPQVDAQGKPIRAPARPAAAKGAPAAAATPAAATAADSAETNDAAKRPVRTVGPTFLPVR